MQVVIPNERHMKIILGDEGVVLNIDHSDSSVTTVSVNYNGELHNIIYTPEAQGNDQLWSEIEVIENRGVWAVPLGSGKTARITFPPEYVPLVTKKLKEFASNRRMF